MDLQQIINQLGFIGDSVAKGTTWIIVQISNLGIKTTPLAAKVINLLIFAGLFYLLIKIVEITKKPLKYLIIILLILLILSTVFSFTI